ncbi:MAG: hypothetical protein IJ180_06180 [Bacteroidales bacterium]|nr:hypothetical protein [Bacteroidales bacterium]
MKKLMDGRNKTITCIFYTSVFMFVSLFLTYFFSVCGWFLGAKFLPMTFPLSFCLLLIVGFWKRKFLCLNTKNVSLIGVLHVFITLLSVFVCSKLYDQSFDGQWYHVKSIHDMAFGWNPVRECNIDSDLYVVHYTKAMETIEASFVALFSNIEGSKAVNFLFAFSLFGFALRFLEDFLNKSKKTTLYLLAVLITLCPVFSYQCLTFYIDYMGYILFVINLISLYFLSKKERFSLPVIAMVVSLSLCIKINIAFWVVVSLLIYALYLLYIKEFKLLKKGIMVAVFSALFGVCFLGYNPYIINLKTDHHILYPLMGKEKVDIMTDNTPEVIRHKNRMVQVTASLFSRPSGCCVYHNITDVWRYYKRDCGQSDVRIGGFGVLFIEVLVLTLLLILFADKRNKKAFYTMLMIEFLLLISLLVLQTGWWARYVPFFYVFVLLPLIYVFKYGIRFRFLKHVAVFLLLLNTYLFFYFSLKYTLKYTKQVNKTIECLQGEEPLHFKTINNAFIYKLEDKKIDYIYQADLPNEDYILWPPVYINSSDTNRVR